jgi:hypothetical protein
MKLMTYHELWTIGMMQEEANILFLPKYIYLNSNSISMSLFLNKKPKD